MDNEKTVSQKMLGLFLTFFCIFLSGCADMFLVKRQQLSPTEIKRLPANKSNFGVTTFFVGPDGQFNYPISENLNSRIEEVIIRKGYSVVDRSKIPEALKEQKFGLTGAVDSETAIKLGKIKGINYLVWVLQRQRKGSDPLLGGAIWETTIRCIDLETMNGVFSKSDEMKQGYLGGFGKQRSSLPYEMLELLESQYGISEKAR